MYISEVNIKGYKSILNLSLNFDPEMNILVGKNGSGKSAVFGAIKNLIFGRGKTYEDFPEHISLELTDDTKELGTIMYEALSNHIPSAFWHFFKDAFVPEEGEPFKIKIIGKKSGSQISIYLKCNGLFFYNAVLSKEHPPLLTGSTVLIQNVTKEQIAGATDLLSFADKSLSGAESLHIDTDLTRALLGYLQTRFFFIEEMRDLQEENPAELLEARKNQSDDPGKNLLNATLDPSTYIGLLFELQNNQNPDKYGIFLTFKEICEGEEDLEVSVVPKRDKNLALRLFERNAGRLLMNTDFPSGLLQKIFFNFVEAYSQYGILFVEEPENNLHVGLQKHLFSKLKIRKGQTFISTHSPEFVDYETFQNVIRLQLIKRCTVSESDIGEREDFDLRKSYYVVDERVFFSDLVLLCEGGSEEILLPMIADEITGTHSYFSKNNVFLIDIGGDTSAGLYKRILDRFRIPCIVVLDNKGRTTGYDEGTDTYCYDAEDFDQCITSGARSSHKALRKKDLALAVLEDYLKGEKGLLMFFTPPANKSFNDLMKVVDDKLEELKKERLGT